MSKKNPRTAKARGESEETRLKCLAREDAANHSGQAEQPCSEQAYRPRLGNLGQWSTIRSERGGRRAVKIGLSVDWAAVVNAQDVALVVAHKGRCREPGC